MPAYRSSGQSLLLTIMLQESPAFTLSHLQTIFPITDRELLEKIVTDLTAAGLPE